MTDDGSERFAHGLSNLPIALVRETERMVKGEHVWPVRDGTDAEVVEWFKQWRQQRGLLFDPALVPKRFDGIVDIELAYWEAEQAVAESKRVPLPAPVAPAPAYYRTKDAKVLIKNLRASFAKVDASFDGVKEATDDLYDRIEKLEAKLAEIEAQRFKYLGTWSQGLEAQSGNAVSHDGSLWIATERTTAKPGTPDSGWLLAVKRGRDGRDVKP